MSYGRGSGGTGPRSTRHLLGPAHRGGGGGGGKKNDGCPLFLLALLPLLPLLVPLLFVLSFFGRRCGEPEHGHPVGRRHRDGKPGSWTYDRPGEDEPDTTTTTERGGAPRSNLPKE